MVISQPNVQLCTIVIFFCELHPQGSLGEPRKLNFDYYVIWNNKYAIFHSHTDEQTSLPVWIGYMRTSQHKLVLSGKHCQNTITW